MQGVVVPIIRSSSGSVTRTVPLDRIPAVDRQRRADWRKTYDPIEHGSNCSECPLKGVHRPVPPKGPTDARTAIVGEGPGRTEIELGSPFMGQSGALLRDLLAESWRILPTRIRRLRYDDLWITNTILCKQPGEDLNRYLKGIVKRNTKERRKLKEEGRLWEYVPILSPLVCCRDRLIRELARMDVIIPVGAHALRTLDPKRDGVVRWRGAPFQWDPKGSM